MALFVTATGTEIGKTFFSTIWMLKYGIKNGWKYWKVLETGGDPESDAMFVKDMIGVENTIPPVYRFQLPASPHYSAKLEGKKIDTEFLHQELKNRSNSKTLIEGAGGVMVPLNDSTLSINFWTQLDMKFILICNTQLGTINHSILSLEAMLSRNLKVHGFYLIGQYTELAESNREAIAKFSGLPWLGTQFLPTKKLNREEIIEVAKVQFDPENKLENLD
jgi:dethiobiotin synthetase